jgi:hypothetical protein
VNQQETPPGSNPAARNRQDWNGSGLDRIGTPAVLAFHGYNRQPHLFADRAGEKAANRMWLPAGGFHQFDCGNATRSFEHLEDAMGLAALPPVVGFRGALRGLFRRRGLSIGAVRLRRNVGRLWRNVRSRGYAFYGDFWFSGFSAAFRRCLFTERLNRLPDPRNGCPTILKLLYRSGSRKAIPNLDQPAGGPVGRQFGQSALVPEAFSAGNGFRILDGSVSRDVVGFSFNREDFHLVSPLPGVCRGDHIHHSVGKHKQANCEDLSRRTIGDEARHARQLASGGN